MNESPLNISILATRPLHPYLMKGNTMYHIIHSIITYNYVSSSLTITSIFVHDFKKWSSFKMKFDLKVINLNLST